MSTYKRSFSLAPLTYSEFGPRVFDKLDDLNKDLSSSMTLEKLVLSSSFSVFNKDFRDCLLWDTGKSVALEVDGWFRVSRASRGSVSSLKKGYLLIRINNNRKWRILCGLCGTIINMF